MLKIDCLPGGIQKEYETRRCWKEESFQSFMFFCQQLALNVIRFFNNWVSISTLFFVITLKVASRSAVCSHISVFCIFLFFLEIQII